MDTNERPFPCGKPRNGPTAYRDSVGRIRCRCCKRRSDRDSWRRKRAEYLAQRNTRKETPDDQINYTVEVRSVTVAASVDSNWESSAVA